MNEDQILNLLIKTYSGLNTEEVDNANEQLDLLGFNQEFINLLFSFIINEKLNEQVKISSIIRLIRIVQNYWMSDDLSNDIRIHFIDSIFQILPIFYDKSNSVFEMILKLLEMIISKQFILDKLNFFLNIANSFLETKEENSNSLFLFVNLHYLIAKKLITSLSTDEIIKEMISHIINLLSDVFINIDDPILMSILLKSISLYIQRNHLFFQYLNENTINKVVILCDNYNEAFNKKLLYEMINFISVIFNDLQNDEINLHFSNFYFNIYQKEPKEKTVKLFKSIMTNDVTFSNVIEPNIESILQYIFNDYFSITEKEKEDLETNIQSFLSSFQTDLFSDSNERTIVYLTLTHVSRNENFSISLLEFVSNVLSSNEINEETCFSALFMLSSAIPFLSAYKDTVFQIISECLSTESQLIISGSLLCCSKLYTFNCPIELYGALFAALESDSLLIKNYAIEAIHELFLNPPQDEVLCNLIRETYGENIVEIISLIFQSADELNDPLLKLSVIYLIQFFGDAFLVNNQDLCVELYYLYTASSDILGTYDSLLTTLTNVIKNAEMKGTSIIETFLPLIQESFEEINDSGISKIITLLSNIIYFSTQETIDYSIFYPYIVSFLQKMPNLIESCSFFFNNLLIKQPDFLMENFDDIINFIFSLYEREVSNSCYIENIGFYLYIFSVLFFINKDSDPSPVIQLLDQESFEMLFHAQNKGASLFFTVVYERTHGEFLQKYDADSLIELYEMKANNKEKMFLIQNCSDFLDKDFLIDLQNSISLIEEEIEDDLIVYLLPLFE